MLMLLVSKPYFVCQSSETEVFTVLVMDQYDLKGTYCNRETDNIHFETFTVLWPCWDAHMWNSVVYKRKGDYNKNTSAQISYKSLV